MVPVFKFITIYYCKSFGNDTVIGYAQIFSCFSFVFVFLLFSKLFSSQSCSLFMYTASISFILMIVWFTLQYHKHLFVHIGANATYSDPMLEVSISWFLSYIWKLPQSAFWYDPATCGCFYTSSHKTFSYWKLEHTQQSLCVLYTQRWDGHRWDCYTCVGRTEQVSLHPIWSGINPGWLFFSQSPAHANVFTAELQPQVQWVRP